MCGVLNCHYVAKHTELYLGWLRFNVICTGNAECLKTNFTDLKDYINLFRGRVQRFEVP
jgi:hypothetical protein